jgi:DNA-binding NarL/FixJ family response regulator
MRSSINSAQPPKPRILVVDDHERVCHGIAHLLESKWDVCGEVGSGQEAIERVRELHPDLVLPDIRMPSMSGIEASQAIREISPEIKIVLISLDDTPEVISQIKVSGADGFVTKNCRSEILMQTVAAVLHASPS